MRSRSRRWADTVASHRGAHSFAGPSSHRREIFSLRAADLFFGRARVNVGVYCDTADSESIEHGDLCGSPCPMARTTPHTMSPLRRTGSVPHVGATFALATGLLELPDLGAAHPTGDKQFTNDGGAIK